MSWNLRLFYDGACPFCKREIGFLQRRDRKGSLDFVDIADCGFNAADYGLEGRDLNAVIHAQTARGDVLSRMEVFRAAYNEVGLGWLLAFTGWPAVKQICDWAYDKFAKNRVMLGGYVGCLCAPQEKVVRQ